MSSNSTDENKFVPPVAKTQQPPAVAKDQLDHDDSKKREVDAVKKETPVAVRTRRYFQQEFHMSSPSDSQLSPCTTKLFGRRGKKMTSAPTAILRNKQQNSIPFKLNE